MVLILAGGMVLWRSGTALVDLWRYWQLNTEVPASVEKWEISADYHPVGVYSYAYQGKIYQGKSSYGKAMPNQYAAHDEIQTFKKDNWSVWINASHPSHSAMMRVFPLKELLYAACTLGIFLYFLYLKFYSDSFSSAK